MDDALLIFKQQQQKQEAQEQQEQLDETVGGRLVDVVTGFVKGLWRTSYTVLTVDLKRAAISYDGPTILRRNRPLQGALVSATPHSYTVQQEEQQQQQGNAAGWGGRLQTSQAQARLKIMQVWDLSKREKEQQWCINLGIGGVFQMDKGHLQPKLRLRTKHSSLHLLPEPLLELRGKWPLGSTGMGVNLRCRLPLNNLDKTWQPRLMLNLFKTDGPSVHFTPEGLLLDDNVMELGKYTRLRVSAALEFPRELPVSEGEKPFKLDVRRVGLKARTL